MSAVARQVARSTGLYNLRTSTARRQARGTRATQTLSGAAGRRYVNDANGRYSGAAVFSRRTGLRVGTMVGMAH